MKVMVVPKYGFVKYREGVFTDVDKYFLYLVTGDVNGVKSLPFEGNFYGEKVEISKMYFTVVAKKMLSMSKRYRHILMNAEFNVSVLVFPSVVLSPPDFDNMVPAIDIYENSRGYTFGIIYDKKSGKWLALQPVRWDVVDNVDSKSFLESFRVIWPAMVETTFEYLNEIIDEEYWLDGDLKILESTK